MKEKILSFIINVDNKLLLLKGSSDDPQFHKSLWYVVTGSKENIDNDLYDTVKREIKEETNLDTEQIINMNWNFIYESLGEKCIEYVFITKVKNKDIKLNEESIDYEWLDLDDFVEKIDWFYNKDELKKRLEILILIYNLKKYEEIYVLGHNSIDADSYFSSYVLTKVLNSFGINANFTILSNYIFSDSDKKLINDYLSEQPTIINIEDLNNKNFILVDHNDINQSIKDDGNVLMAFDHHIDSKKVKKCYSVEYTSTLLYIYYLFKEIYTFNDYEKTLISLSIISDSEYLSSSRFKESDKKLYDELNINLDIDNLRNKYFKTTDFNLDIDYNIKNNYKYYEIDGYKINRVILKAYNEDRKYIKKYVNRLEDIKFNYIFIWNEYDTNKTLVYYKGNKVKEYDYILSSSVLIIKDLIKFDIIK